MPEGEQKAAENRLGKEIRIWDGLSGFSDSSREGEWKRIRTGGRKSRRDLSNRRKCLQLFLEQEACRRQEREMRQGIKGKRVKQILDVLIMLCGIVYIYCILKEIRAWRITPFFLLVVAVVLMWVMYDFYLLQSKEKPDSLLSVPEALPAHGLQRLILLDEQGKPVKSWDLQGKISLIIGKAGESQELDIDLSDCEYSSFIDFQHAVLNFCLDQWYVEDLGSQNGVRIQKVEDGECYRVIHRPCKVTAGDILYIANTKLLLT